MSSLEKRHTGQRGSMQGHHKFSDGFSDTSSSGSFMDDTDREVSNLTDRAFRSLCIGEEAIYNDSEFPSSPTERHDAFVEETQQKIVSQETFSYRIQDSGEPEEQSKMASTFQHSYTDVTHQEQAFMEGGLSYMNNGSKEVTWQQSRSASRVSSLIKAFSSGECYHESGTCDVNLARDSYRDFGSESWDRSALLTIQRELSQFSGHHHNIKSGPFQSYRNHFYTSDVAAAVAKMDTKVLMNSSKRKIKELNSTNCFFHSEFSPFQLWEEYNRFPFESTNVSGFMSPSEFPRWYDSPMYKELKDNNRIPNSPCESRLFNQRHIQDVVVSQRSRSTVVQKASAIEKRCESEMASNYPPWKKNNNFVRNKLPGNRPSTVSPSNERTCRPDSNLFSSNKVTHELVVESTVPSSVTPFNITQLLTPVIHTRQETETSEILQFAHTPSVSDYSSQGETDPKLQTDFKHLRDSYKSKASGLLFNLKDNRKRVKSTYSPTRFKGQEITDRHKQTSRLEGRESRFSDILVSQETAQENFIGTDSRASCNLIREPSAAPITPKDYTDGFGSYDNLTLMLPQIQDGVANYKSFRGSSEGHPHSRDPLANTELSTHNLSAQSKSSLTSEGQLKDLNGTFSPARPEIANMLPKAYPPTHSLPVQTSERYGQSDNMSENDLKQRKDFGRKPCIEYSQNEAIKERCSWDHIGSVKETNGRSESRPFGGEIAALIEMDKQRKATAKQYSANDSYSVRKETYMQKVNEDIKLGRLAKEEETISPRKTPYSDKSVHDKQLNTFPKPTESYGISRNILQNKTSPLKEVYCGLQSFNVNNDLEPMASSNSMATQNTFDQSAPLQDHKGQKNEGLYSHQPYKYEPNKQWHIASTSEDRHTKESVAWTLKQPEMMEQTVARSYKMSNTSSSTQHINHNEFSNNNNGAWNPTVVPIDTSDKNNTTKQENRFSINDILAIRDNEQARRVKDNTFVLAKSEHSQNQIKYDTADKLTISEPVKEQEQQGYKVQDVTSPSPGYIRKDFHNTNETNINNDRKDRIMIKDPDKVTTKVFSYKERGQSKQEILTSKLKAHAQKEISAIKEKGLAKQGILARNTTKTSMNINSDGQEGHSVKKEITADKLNHLFQDITYSSVTQNKEQFKTHNDHPKNGSPPSLEKQTSYHFEDNQKAVLEKKGENVKHKHLAIERQNDKHPADDKEMKEEMFTPDRVADIKNDVQKNYQPSPINKESEKQRHEMSPSELMSSHLTAAVKKEKSTPHNPPLILNEKQTIQHDQKENLYGRQDTCSEKAMTKPADQTKKDLPDITYSSVTQKKEQIKTHNDHPKNVSPPSMEKHPSYHFEDSQKAVLEKKSENVKLRHLALERQNDKHPADDKEMKKETFTPERAENIKNEVQKNYQLSQISPKDVNTNKESEKQRHEMSPTKLMSGHLTAAVKKENSTPHNPPAILNEKQTIQHDQKENMYGLQYTCSEKAMNKPADQTKKDVPDITYSSVTQNNEHIKTYNDHPKNGSPPSMEKQPLHFEDNQKAVLEQKGENIKHKHLAIERQNYKHPADDKEMKKEMFTAERAANLKNDVQKNYQPSRISPKDVNTNKVSEKQRHEMSPSELMSGHLTAAIKKENSISHNPPAILNEKQTIQHDQKENLYGRQHTSGSEKAMTKPADQTKKDLQVTSTETTKSNSSLKKNSLLGLDRNTEEPNVHHKSKITVEQSKDEPIKNSSVITASQLTSSSSDMKFKNGIPPSKRLMEPAKSELTSNLQTNTLIADAEKLLNRTYKHNSGDSSDSEASSTENMVRINSVPANNPAPQRTWEPETLKPFNNEKNITTKENDLAKQQNNISQVKAVETTSANQMMESQSKPGTNKQSLTQIASDKAKESCQQEEFHQDDKNTKTLLSFDNNELPRSHQSMTRIRNDSEAVKNSQPREKKTESASPKQKEQGFPRPLDISLEKNKEFFKSTKESQEVNPGNSEPQKAAEDKLQPNVFSQHKLLVDEGANQKNNGQPVSTQIEKYSADISNITILTPSKNEPAEEPMIYSICVSRKTEAPSDDEPMIYSICVSSNSHIDNQQNTRKLDEVSSDETKRCVKDKSFHIKNDKAENLHDDVQTQTKVSSNIEEKEDKIGKCEPPATTDKSSVMGRISTSYEDLLVKYGLSVRDPVHLPSKHMQDERERKEKEETGTHHSQKTIKHGINKPLASKEKSLDDTQTHLDDTRHAPIPQESITSQPLKENESEIKQAQQDIPSITCSNNMAEKQQITGNDIPKLVHSTRDAALMAKDLENVEQQDQDTHNIDPSMQSRRNYIQSKEKKVEEQMGNTEKTQSLRMKGNTIDDASNSRKSPKKPENAFLTAKQPAIMSESRRATDTEVVKAPISNESMANNQLTEITFPGWIKPKKKPQMVEGEDKMFNHTDTFMPQKNTLNGRETLNLNVQKTTHETKQEDSIIVMKQGSVSNKDAPTLQNNGKGDLREKKAQEKLQVEFKTSNEVTNRKKMVLKDGAATDVSNYKDKVSSIGEDVCIVVKQDQASFEVPKNNLEDINVSTEEVSSNKEFMASHKNQHEVIKREHLNGKKAAVVTDRVSEKDFTGQKTLPLKTPTAQNEPKTVDKLKGTSETTPKLTCGVGKEITPPKKNGPSESEKASQGPVWKQEINIYDNKQPTLNSDKRKKEDPVLSLVEQNNGDLKVNENRNSFRGKKERNVEATETKQAEWTNTNQSQPGRSFVPETKGSASYSNSQDNSQLNQQNTNKEGIVSKSEATQRNNKGTRPEISAIADYARLKVIAAEDDTKENDIFPKLDFYDQSVLIIHKDSQVNVPDTGGETKREIISEEKSQLNKQTVKETFSQNHNQLNPSMSTAQAKPISLVASGSQGGATSMGTQLRALPNHKESNTKPAFLEHPNRGEIPKLYQPKNPKGTNTVPLQAEGTISRVRLTHDKTTEKGNISHSGRQESLANLPSSSTVKLAHNQINMTSTPGEEMEELQYYTVNALDTELKPKETIEPPPPSFKMSQNKDSEEEKKEDRLFLQSPTDYGKVHTTGPRSNSSSPAMGKPNMFRVKDNTMRTSSVTKTVKPLFHRSFSDDFRVGSPKEHLSGSEKEDEILPKQSANPPVLHEPAIAVHRPHKVKETTHNNFSSAEYTTKQSKSHQRRSQLFDEEETHSVISTMSEDMDNCTASLTELSDISLAFMPRKETYRDNYQRPASACYERPESACYERPESACSDMRPLGKPPTVPPKSEKALRRAQRLATRRMKKADTPKMPPENQEQLESKSIRDVAEMPSSPSDTLSTHPAVQASPPLSQYDIQPNYTHPTHSVVAQPFPMTQRKLLQDPNSGQYFMVDVPLPVKTKTFYDPETGKYVQLNVRQRSQGALTQSAPVEMLNAPYMLYRGFLPMAASSLPPLRSSSEMSTPAGLTDEQDMLETGSELWRQNVYPQNVENSINTNERHTDIITISELEDFAMEST
ncbi:microtubule-associated protein futsch [Pimephales promelas]|uniref:microtubule-associated protein futsch n=1 Tax=Pimephales promelas TaxID=90988 RepID=UPI0019558229|nr:microtubule-associated protein futsch [Pimephales promelas]